MKSLICTFLILIICSNSYGQSRWEDHFNYSEVKEIHQIDNKLYCVSSNALFSYDVEFNEIEKISKVNQLNGVQPTSAAYNEELDYLLIGYQNGELDILGEESENFIEIPLDDYSGEKSINHIATEGNIMLISAPYGMSIFDLDRREFSETTFFRQNGGFIQVNESEIYNGQVYSASDQGIFSHPIDELIPNFNNWSLANGLSPSKFNHIQKFGDLLMASSYGNLYVLEDNNWRTIQNLGVINDLNVNQDNLIVTTQNRIIVFNTNLESIDEAIFSYELESGSYVNGEIYAGTRAYGLIKETNQREFIYPDGPFSNNSYSVAAQGGRIWATPGGLKNYNIPAGNQEGFFQYIDKKWYHIDNQITNGAKDFIQISYNPNNIEQIFAATWDNDHGLFEFENNELIQEYDQVIKRLYTNTDQILRLGGSAMDQEGNLYVTHTFINGLGHSSLLKRTASGNWSKKEFTAYAEGAGIKEPIIGSNGYIWIAQTRGDGVIVTNMDNTYQILSGEETGNLPTNNVYAISIDDNGTAWIGTRQGLRIKRNPIGELEAGNITTEPVIIVQNGIPEALLTDTNISDIETDSSNRKWIATQGAGVFYLSENGTEVISHFTEDESPLPSNNVNDIAVDTDTGMVYFATESGLVSYKGDAVNTGDTFGDVLAYPNPVRPGYDGPITIKGLASNTEAKIVDVVGNLIYSAQEAGGIIQWNQTNLQGKMVASGVYLVLLISGDGQEHTTTKIAIVR